MVGISSSSGSYSDQSILLPNQQIPYGYVSIEIPRLPMFIIFQIKRFPNFLKVIKIQFFTQFDHTAHFHFNSKNHSVLSFSEKWLLRL